MTIAEPCFSVNAGGVGRFDDVGEDEFDIGRGQDMLVIVARSDFPAIRDLFVEGSQVVKKLAHAWQRIIS